MADIVHAESCGHRKISAFVMNSKNRSLTVNLKASVTAGFTIRRKNSMVHIFQTVGIALN